MNYTHTNKNRMNTAGWTSPFAGLDKQLESLFAGFPSLFDFDTDSAFSASSGTLRTLWYEKEDAYQVRLDLPGVGKDNISLEIEDGVLSVKATRAFQGESEGEKSRPQFTYKKSIELPEGTQEDKVSANYEDGVLSLTLPRGEKAKPRQIQVDSAS